MIIGCGIVIIGLLGCAMLAQGVASLFNGAAAAEMGATLMLNQVMQPIGLILVGVLGIGAGVGLGLLLPGIARLRKGNVPGEISALSTPQYDELLPGEQPVVLPQLQLPAPTPVHRSVGKHEPALTLVDSNKHDKRNIVEISLDEEW